LRDCGTSRDARRMFVFFFLLSQQRKIFKKSKIKLHKSFQMSAPTCLLHHVQQHNHTSFRFHAVGRLDERGGRIAKVQLLPEAIITASTPHATVAVNLKAIPTEAPAFEIMDKSAHRPSPRYLLGGQPNPLYPIDPTV